MLDELARLPPRAIVIYLSIFEDGTGRRFIPRDLAANISAAAKAPVYGVYETFLGRGIVGGYIDSFEAIGREAARLGLRVLTGEPAASLPPEDVQTQAFMVDGRQMRRWGLDEARLPPGTIVRFEQPSLWKQYRDQILAVAAVVALQSALIAALLLQGRRRRRAEELLREGEQRYRDRGQPDRAVCRYLPDTTLHLRQRGLLPVLCSRPGGLIGRKFIKLIPESWRAAC